MLKVRLFRPFSSAHLSRRCPTLCKCHRVLDRTKEPGAIGEPLYQDVVTALSEAWVEHAENLALPRVIGGRYGLSSKEFTPAMAKSVFDALAAASLRITLPSASRTMSPIPA